MFATMEFPEHRSLGAAVRSESTQDFLKRVLGNHTTGMMSRTETTLVTNHGHLYHCNDVSPANFPGGTISLMVQAAHQAYSCHMGFGLRPEVVWYAVVSEIGEHIRQNFGAYRDLLGPDWQNGPRSLRVFSNSPSEIIVEFYDALVNAVGAELGSLFVPLLSTVDEEARITLISAFAEAAGPYHYFQESTLCGIRRIEIGGTPQDWLLLRNNAARLAELFPALQYYLSEVENILHRIYCTLSGLEINLGTFWEDLYKWRGDGSNGPRVQGWITALFAHKRNEEGRQLRSRFDWPNRHRVGFDLGQFTSHISTVPLLGSEDAHPNRHLLAGVLGVEHHTAENSRVPVLTPRLGWGVIRMG